MGAFTRGGIAAASVGLAVAAAPVAHAEDYNSMSGNGTHNIGGMDGKNWGVWESAGGTACEWSVLLISPDAPGEVLNSGSGGRGEAQQVTINPPGHVDLDGLINGNRIVFMTNGCDTWQRT